DVEGEVNGLITYDRKQVKVNPQMMRILHEPSYRQPQAWQVAVNDRELEPQELHVSREKLTDEQLAEPDAGSFSVERGPVKFKKGQEGVFYREFTLDKHCEHLQLRVFANAD